MAMLAPRQRAHTFDGLDTEAVEYALQFGRDLDRNLADRFVGMYVNDWTLDYGPTGRKAISTLLAEGARAGLVPASREIEYVTAR